MRKITPQEIEALLKEDWQDLFELNVKNGSIVLSHFDGKYRLAGLDSADPNYVSGGTIEFSTELAVQIINYAQEFKSIQKDKPSLNTKHFGLSYQEADLHIIKISDDFEGCFLYLTDRQVEMLAECLETLFKKIKPQVA